MTIEQFLTSSNILSDTAKANFTFTAGENLGIIENSMILNHGERELLYPDDRIQNLCEFICKANKFGWEKLYSIMSIAYQPMKKTNITNTTASTGSNTDTRTPNTITKQKKRAYDSDTMTEVENEESTGTDVTASNASTSGTNTRDGYENISFRDVVDDEKSIAELRFFDILASEIANKISLQVFFEEE